MPAVITDSGQKVRRPTGITILSVLYFLIGFFYLIKVIQSACQWPILQNLPISVSPIYLAVDGIIWCLAGLVLGVGLRKGKSWSRPAALVISTLYSLVFWADRLWIAQPEGLALRWPVNLVLTISILGSIFLVLNHKTSQPFFRKIPAKIP